MAGQKQLSTVPSYTYNDTSDENIKRFCDRNGDWTHYWLEKEKKFVPAVNHILELGFNKGPGFRRYLETHTKEEIQRVLTAKGDEGSRSHMAIRNLLDGSEVTMSVDYPSELIPNLEMPLSDDEWDNIKGWMHWANDYNPHTIATEETISDGKCAGTLDWFGVITVRSGDKNFEKSLWGQDVLILPDWKTSAQIWIDYAAQTAKYFDMVRTYPKFAKFIQAFDPKNVFTGIVRVGTQHKVGYEFETWDLKRTTGKHLESFNAATVIARMHEPVFEPKIVDTPTRFYINVPKAKLPKVPKVKKSR